MMYQTVGEIGEDPAWVPDLYQRMDNRITRPGLLTGESEYAIRKCYLDADLYYAARQLEGIDLDGSYICM